MPILHALCYASRRSSFIQLTPYPYLLNIANLKRKNTLSKNQHVIFLFCAVISCIFATGCNTSIKQQDIVNACEFSSGSWQNDHCICGTEACGDGIVCNTITQQCANHSVDNNNCPTNALPVSGEEALSLWTADAPAKNALISYINTITQPGKDFIPVANRIAVFDLDGTLLCETDPNNLDYNLYV